MCSKYFFQSIIHPDTEKKIFMPFRMSGMNLIILYLKARVIDIDFCCISLLINYQLLFLIKCTVFVLSNARMLIRILLRLQGS